jgi:hypothetical protein
MQLELILTNIAKCCTVYSMRTYATLAQRLELALNNKLTKSLLARQYPHFLSIESSSTLLQINIASSVDESTVACPHLCKEPQILTVEDYLALKQPCQH